MFDIKIVREPGGGRILVKGIGEDGLMVRFGNSESSVQEAIEKLCPAIADKFRAEFVIAMLKDLESKLRDKEA
jgi:hypothetical protein